MSSPILFCIGGKNPQYNGKESECGMPNCFQLLDKETGNPTQFSEIDEKLCAEFKQPVHPTHYMWGWYDSIGFKIAIGKTEAEIRQDYVDLKAELPTASWPDDLLKVCDYIFAHYTARAWHENSGFATDRG